MSVSKLLILLFFVGLFTGCSQKEILIQNEIVKKTPLNLNNPEAIKLNNIQYIVVTDKNSDSVFNKLKYENKEQVLYAITAEDYEMLSLNLSYIKKYIIEQQLIIKSYKDYYESSND